MSVSYRPQAISLQDSFAANALTTEFSNLSDLSDWYNDASSYRYAARENSEFNASDSNTSFVSQPAVSLPQVVRQAEQEIHVECEPPPGWREIEPGVYVPIGNEDGIAHAVIMEKIPPLWEFLPEYEINSPIVEIESEYETGPLPIVPGWTSGIENQSGYIQLIPEFEGAVTQPLLVPLEDLVIPHEATESGLPGYWIDAVTECDDSLHFWPDVTDNIENLPGFSPESFPLLIPEIEDVVIQPLIISLGNPAVPDELIKLPGSISPETSVAELSVVSSLEDMLMDSSEQLSEFLFSEMTASVTENFMPLHVPPVISLPDDLALQSDHFI